MTARILVVDDDSFNREAIREVLFEEGYSVLTAPNGRSALDIVERTPVDLILLDIYMSVMDGPAFAHEYRRLPGPHAPIIVITARESAAAQAAAIQADGYLGKPFEVDELLKAVKGLLDSDP